MHPAGVAVLVGCLVAPLVTWFPMLAHRFPALGLPAYQPAAGIDLWHLQTLWLTGLLAIAGVAWRRDRWAACAVIVAAVTLWYRGLRLDPTHTVIFAFGVLLLCAVRQLTPEWAGRARPLLVGLGAIQVAYLIQQHVGADVLWGPLFGGVPVGQIQPLGTLGGVNASSGYVAILAPLLPLWLVLPAVWVVWAGHSLGALLALTAGLLVRYRVRWPWLVVGAAMLTMLTFTVPLTRETQGNRFRVWEFAGAHWWESGPGAVALGYGLGGWAQRVPAQQQAAKFLPLGEIWMEAHNEPLQWVVEMGLVGLALLAAWSWQHRRMFAHPVWGGSLVALAVDTLSWHPFHIVSSALVAILVVGLATRDTEEPACAA